MSAEGTGELIETLLSYLGDSLRAVATYDLDGYQLLYRRSDIDELYATDDLDEIFHDMVLEGIGSEYLEQLFNAGALRCTVHTFSEAVVCHFITSERGGLVVSFDTDTDVKLVEFVDACCEAGNDWCGQLSA